MKLKILSYSAASNKESASKLKYNGNHIYRPGIAIQAMNRKSENPYDMVAVRDISKAALDELNSTMMVMGYKSYIHPDWNSVQQWRYSSVSVLYALNDVKFKQIFGDESYETTLRSVCGTFDLEGNEILYKTNHIPLVNDQIGESWTEKQIRRKEEMLKYEVRWQRENDSRLALSEGDFNGNSLPRTKFYCKNYYKLFCYKDLISGQKTYGNKQLDSVFISKAFREEKCPIDVKAEVLPDFYNQFSDHKMISISLETK